MCSFFIYLLSSLKQPPGNKNLNLLEFFNKEVGNPTPEVVDSIGPSFDIKSLYVYASGGISNISVPSQIVFCILAGFNKLLYLTLSE